MELLIVLLPLFGALLAMPLANVMGARASELLTIVFLAVSCLLSWWVFFDVAIGHHVRETIQVFTFIESGNFKAEWAMRLDSLTAVMLVVVTTVSTLVHVYSVGYMHDDNSRPRFFAYLSLFTFAMLCLVTADNFIQLFFGWEGVGLASYLLIGFYHHKKSANDAAIKAFVVNRIGDFGLVLGIMAIFFVFGSVQFDDVFQAITSNQMVAPFGATAAAPIQTMSFNFLGANLHALTVIGILLFIGAMGKSAQFLLHTWLPDAMEGPTPVSALIHAATMVTAGVFLVCRCSFIYEYAPVAAGMITLVGAITAFFAATVGLLQDDIKKVVAYSTCSQLGYMFFAAGVGAYNVAMFHLFTHAFFKALLFLGSGCVIHALHHEQDMKKMGGIRGMLPFTYLMMIIGTIAITGVGIPGLKLFGEIPFGTAGFVSKDLIIESAFAGGEAGLRFGNFAFVMGILVAVMTSFYSWRLIFLTFHRKPRAPAEHMRHPHHVSDWMLGPLLPLALGGLIAGMFGYSHFAGKNASDFWAGSLYQENLVATHGPAVAGDHGAAQVTPADDHGTLTAQDHSVPAADHAASTGDHAGENGGGHDFPVWVIWAPFAAMILGFGTAFMHYMRGSSALRPGILIPGGMIHDFLKNKWYFDELYRAIFVKPTAAIARLLWKQGDERVIDRFGPDGLTGLAGWGAKMMVRLQSGYIYTYAFAMLIGIAVFLLIILTGGNA